MIYPRIKGLELFYQEGREIIFYDFGNFKQLQELIEYYLVHDEERESIRRAAMKRTKEVHLYNHRLQNIIDTVYGNESFR